MFLKLMSSRLIASQKKTKPQCGFCCLERVCSKTGNQTQTIHEGSFPTGGWMGAISNQCAY